MENLMIFFVAIFVIAAFFSGYLFQKISSRLRRRRSLNARKIDSAWRDLSSEQIQGLVRVLGNQKTDTVKHSMGKKLVFTSQYGEDIFLAEFFNFKTNGFFIEIGAYDGVFLSNTYVFEQLGWKGVLVEPLPEKYRECVSNRPNSFVINAAVGISSEKTTEITHVIGIYPSTNETLSTHSFINAVSNENSVGKLERLKRLGAKVENFTVPIYRFDDIAFECGMTADTSVDFISIDCEGMDFDVLKSINLNIWRPRLLLIESYNYEIVRYLEKFGYFPALSTLGNTIFAHDSLDRDNLTKEKFWQVVLGDFEKVKNQQD